MQEQLSEVLAPYHGQRGATIPVLQKVQEKLGGIKTYGMSEIKHELHERMREILEYELDIE